MKKPISTRSSKERNKYEQLFEPNKDSDIHSKDDKNRNIKPKDELEKLK